MNIQRKKSRWYTQLTHAIGSTGWGARLFSFLLHHLDDLVFKLTVGRTTLTSFLGGLTIVMVTSTGAKSGLPRTIPLIAIPHPDHENTICLIASNWGQQKYPAWYYNLKANPQATIEYQGAMYTCRVYEADGDEYQKIWDEATKFYIGYTQYRKCVVERHIPIMVLTPNVQAQ